SPKKSPEKRRGTDTTTAFKRRAQAYTRNVPPGTGAHAPSVRGQRCRMEVFDEYSWLSARADHAPAVQYPAQLRLVADHVYAAGQIGFGAAVHQAAEIFCQDGCHPAADAGDPEDVRQKPDKDERGAAEALPA